MTTKFTIMVTTETVPGYINKKAALPRPSTKNGARTPAFLIDRAQLSDAGGSAFYIMVLIITAVSVFVHELLHGFGWAIFGLKWLVSGFFRRLLHLFSCCHSEYLQITISGKQAVKLKKWI